MNSTKIQQEIINFSVSIEPPDEKKIKIVEEFFSYHAPHLLDQDSFIRELSYIIIRILFEKVDPHEDIDYSVLYLLQYTSTRSTKTIHLFNHFLQTQFDTSLTDEEMILLVLSSSD